MAWSDNKITYHLFKEECGFRGPAQTLCPFSHHIPFHQGKSDPSRDFQARQDNLTCFKMTLVLSAPPRSPSFSPPISSRGAELAQMRDTLKNKLLVWDWVDSDGWPVLKGTEGKGAVGSAYYFSGYKALMFSLIWHFPNQKALASRMWANIHGLTSSSIQTCLSCDRTMVSLEFSWPEAKTKTIREYVLTK